MKLPWDKRYLQISFHAILTLVISYALIRLLDSAGFVIVNIRTILDKAAALMGWMLSVFSVLVISFVIAYLLNPLAEFFQNKYDEMFKNRLADKYFKRIRRIIKSLRKNTRPCPTYKRRTQGALLAYIFIIFIIFIISLAVYLQVDGFKKKSGDGFGQSVVFSFDKTRNDLSEFYAGLRTTLEEWAVSDEIQNAVSRFAEYLMGAIKSLSDRIIPFAASAGGKILNFFISTVIAFYFIRDKDLIKRRADDVLTVVAGPKTKKRVILVLSDIHAIFSGYIIGQLTDAAIMCVLLSIGLSLVGVDFAVIIGVFSGFSNIVPYFGALTGFVLSVFVALISDNPSKAVYAGIVVIILQQIDGMFIVPKVVGKKVSLSPALVLLSLSAGGAMFGFTGVLFAVPGCAILKVFFTKLFERLKIRKDVKLS